jgi:hypothetical protein
MIEPASLLVGAGILLGGWLLGRYAPTRRKAAPRPEPLCGCGHHHAYHDPKTGVCHATVRHKGTDTVSAYDRQCTCRQYSGPVAIDSYYAPELTTRDPS